MLRFKLLIPLCAATLLASHTPALRAAPALGAQYRLGVGDDLEITVSNHPDVNTKVTVRPDGKITLPRVGELSASGKTALALGRDIERILARTLNNARVQVIVTAAAPRLASVSGAVKSPAPYPVKAGTRVLDLIARAGGPTAKVSRISGRVIRAGQTIRFSLADALKDPAGRANIPIRPDDTVILDEAEFTKQLSVAGSVGRPGAFDLDEGLTVVRLLAEAGGPADDAALRSAYILRAGRTIPLDLSGFQDGSIAPNAPVNQFRFEAGDVLFVPKAKTTEVSIIGPVARPGAYALTDNLTLISLLAKAGNPSDGAALRKAYVLRAGKQIPVDLRAMLVEGQTNPELAGFAMEDGDVLVIPDATEQVTVSGQIARPGAYNLSDDLTVISLLAKAGNALPNGSLREAYVLRQGIPIPLDLNAFLSGTKDKPWLTNFRLKPGDTLVIPENKVFYAVLGQVVAPGKFAYPETPADASVLRALINAGGPAAPGREGGANLGEARIVRVIGGRPTAIPVNLNDVLNNKKGTTTQNVVLQPGDLLYVPPKGRGFQLGDALQAAAVYNVFR